MTNLNENSSTPILDTIENLIDTGMDEYNKDCDNLKHGGKCTECSNYKECSDEYIEFFTLNMRKDEYLKIEDIINRFVKIDREYDHSPWSLMQIFTNLNMIVSKTKDEIIESSD